MDARAFLQHVIAWDATGFVTIHWRHRSSTHFHGRSCHTIDEALATIERISKDGVDVYFCVSRQGLNSGKRSRATATSLVSVFADLDVGADSPKKYPNQGEAIVALFVFCDQVGIPRPSLVLSSGFGVHCYWLSNKTLSVEEWQPFANALKAAGLQHGLKFDAGLTGDVVRILRVPDTTNWKVDGDPRPVYVLDKYSPGTRHDFATAFATISNPNILPFPPTPPPLPPGVKIEMAPTFVRLKLERPELIRQIAGGIENPPPPDFDLVCKVCPWLAEARDTGGKDFDEPQWNLTTYTATFFPDPIGHELAHQLGNKHPDYVFEKTERKWLQKVQERAANPKLGWPQCKTIYENGSTHCASCRLLQLGQSPLNFGFADAVPPDDLFETPPELDDEELAELGGSRPPELNLPEGFCVNQTGHICVMRRIKVGKAKVLRIPQLLRTKIWKPHLQHRDGAFGLAFTSETDMGSSHEVFIGGGDAFGTPLKYLASRFVFPMSDADEKKITPQVQRLMSSWMHKLSQQQVALRDAGTFGWRYEDGKIIGFVYGKCLHKLDGTTAPVVDTGDDEFKRWYMPIGSKEAWLRAARLITNRQQVELDIILTVAFAAPLVVFIGNMYAAVLSIWGDPGSSKSTAQQVAAAMWGHPKQTRESLTSTPKSVQGRLGRIKNLPAYWDDIQDERHQDYLAQTMFVATEGTEGGRLNPDATYKERKDWQTMLLACSNASFVEYLLKKQKSTTAGLRRVLEFEFNKRQNNITGMINSVDANRAFAELEHNYGRMGEDYAKFLASNLEEVKALVKTTTDKFSAMVQSESDETFWWGICGCLIAGATLAKRMGVDVDVTKITIFLEKVLHNNRRIRGQEGTEGGSFTNTEMGLTGFLNLHANDGTVLYVSKMFEHRSIEVNVVHYPLAGKQILIQIAKDERRIVISKRALRDHLNKEDIHARQVLEGLVKHFKATETKLTLGAGTSVAQTQEAVIDIPVPVGNDLLEHFLFNRGKPIGDPTE